MAVASILVVDSDPDAREQHVLALEQDGHVVASAPDGIEAIAAVRAAPPLVLVCDLDLPRLDGWGVLDQLKSHDDPAISQVLVVVTSAARSEADEVRAGIEGAVRHLLKPIAPDRLCVEVMEVLDGGPELVQRRRAQSTALERLARQERGDAPDVERGPRLTRLERADRMPTEPSPPRSDLDLAGLTDKQRMLVDALRQAPSVAAAASMLEVSRSNVYASLRRISRKLDTGSVPSLLRLIRTDKLRS